MSLGQEWDITSGVGLTALGAAACRAIESTRPDRLIDDGYAAAFIAAGSPVPLLSRWRLDVSSELEALLLNASHYIGLRTRFFDDFLVTTGSPAAGGPAGADGGPRQVVLLAAGLDTRAFRLAWPDGVRLFEVDQPKVLEFKDSVLAAADAQPRCDRRPVTADLREDWPRALRAAGFDPGTPTAWLAEGLLMYLPAEAEGRLFEHIDDLSAPGSRLAVEHSFDSADLLGSDAVGTVRDAHGFDLAGLFKADDRPFDASRLTGRGWQVTEEPAATVAARYGRPVLDPGLAALPGTPLPLANWIAFVTAQRATPDRP
jgi:methyltransferase (TIGR00027 family)